MREGEYFEEEVMEDAVTELNSDEILEIQEEYRRKRLIESLIGPLVSTIFHVVLIIVMAIIVVDQVTEKKAEIQVELAEEEEVVLEEPEEIPEPEEIIEETDITTPQVTTVAVDNVETNDTALEDVNDEAPSTDDNSSIDMVSEVTVSPSAFSSSSISGGRGAAGRAGSLSKFGGNKKGQQNLMRALMWLAKVQLPDGSWGSNKRSRPALTGLALLTFLAHGETPTSRQFGKTVSTAIQWLVSDPINYNGGAGSYSHSIKTYALAEAYSMTGISSIEGKMLDCIQVIIKNQQNGGCFNYGYSKDEARQDLSLAGWTYQAMKAAYGTNLEIEGLEGAIYKAIAYLKKMGGSSSSFPYSSKNNQPAGHSKHTIRAVGVLCLQLFAEGNCGEIKDELKKIATEDLAKLSWTKGPKESLYGWYYATQCMFQAGGKYWKAWNRKFQLVLNANQHKEGYWEYTPTGGHIDPAGDDLSIKVYATTLCALQLTVYYRYLPSSGKGGGGFAEKARKHKKALAKQKPEDDEEELDLLN